MFRPLTHARPRWRQAPRRGGAILLTCFSLITILMVLGLAFMMYAAKEKAVAQAYSEAASRSTRLAPDPTDTANRFFGTLIYDELDDHDPLNGGAALLNAMRGHSIARSMYGSRYDFSAPYWTGSTTPWAGVGTFHETNTYGDRALQVNHTLMMMGTTPYLLDPEWTGSRAVAATGVPPFATSRTGSYVGKHAGYTYADLKSLWLGARDPATGEVLVPSFHRPWLFGSLADNNPNWRNATGKLLILRPRPLEHPKFPRVPPNADGTYTGDVQNLPGHVGIQKNDSIWMHIGLPQVTLEDGRIVQPMVAPLILPLDGLFDMSVHGNQLATGSTHWSHPGYGPWETNIGYGLVPYGTVPYSPALPTYAAAEAERYKLVKDRLATRDAAFDPFTAGRQVPNYSPVAWDGQPVTFALPTGNSLSGLPSFGGFQSNNVAVLATPAPGHPAGYSTNDWRDRSDPLAVANSPIYPYSDLKRLSIRYAFTPDSYFQAFVTKPPAGATATFLGDPTNFPFIISAGATTRASYRLDPAHTRRLLFSPKNHSLERPAVTPNFSRTVAESLQIPAGTTKPGALFTTPVAYPSPGPMPPGGIRDFAGDNLWVNVHAALGAVNLNRPLADYRADLTTPLAVGNAGNEILADADRRALAKDIFARLVVALGAAVSVDASGNVTVLAAPATPQYDALRYLAQVAVNLVDYIDNDDVNTVFVWNPSNPATDLSAAEVGNRAVFGVEKPRLVINEAYSEIVNDPNDAVNGNGNGMGGNLPPAGPAQVRFWLELLNPTSTPIAGTPLGDGSVALSAYRIEIRRADRQTGVAAGSRDAALNTQNDFLFTNPTNTTGSFEPTAGAPDAAFTFPAGSVGPNNGAYSPAAAALPANGFLLVGPPAANRGDDFAPNGGVWANKVESGAPTNAPGSAAMGYTMALPGAGVVTNAEFKRNIVLLRRLANPHLLAGPTNPYITVDTMDYVPSFDSIHRLTGGGLNRNPQAAMNANPMGYDPSGSRFAVGKVQPYAGRSVAIAPAGPGNHNVYNNNNARAVASSLQNSMVRDQTTANGGNQPRHTFGRHNGNAGQPAGTTFTPGTPATLSDTIMTPFDWLIHLDRPLETLGDVFFARDCAPHRLTTEFVVPTGVAPGLNYEVSSPRWSFHNDGLARGLEYLTVKSPDERVGHGGRVGGKINVNAMQDRRVAQGAWDPQASNVFNLDFVNNTVWGDAAVAGTSWMKSRTPLQTRLGADGTTQFQVPVPTSSVADQTGGTDRPFYSFGAPAAAPVAPGTTIGTFAYTQPSTTGDGDTILRQAPVVAPAVPGPPLLYQTAQTHPYLQSEPMRKVMNNVTTKSHMFAVYVTIGYFEVLPSTMTSPPWPSGVPLPPQFGAEVYDKIPGDMRQKYSAVIDMSNMALKANPPANDPDPHATGRPFFTALTATARVAAPTLSIACAAGTVGAAGTLTVMADGQAVTIQVNDQLVIGYGAEQQVVTVSGVTAFDPTTRVGQVTVTGLGRDAWGGSSVSNVRPGYAGPRYVDATGGKQFVFDYTAARYKPVIPYVERLR